MKPVTVAAACRFFDKESVVKQRRILLKGSRHVIDLDWPTGVH